MAATEKEVSDLCTWLENQEIFIKRKKKSGMALLADLAKDKKTHLQRPEVLMAAHTKGLIEFGRRNYSSSCKSVKLDPPNSDMKQGDEREQVQVQELEYQLDDDWSWADFSKPGRGTVMELLDEDKNLSDEHRKLGLGLWLRRTSKAVVAEAA